MPPTAAPSTRRAPGTRTPSRGRACARSRRAARIARAPAAAAGPASNPATVRNGPSAQIANTASTTFHRRASSPSNHVPRPISSTTIGHDAEPADRFDAVETETVVERAHGAAVQRMKRIADERRERIDAARRAAPEICLADVAAGQREPERLRDERQAQQRERRDGNHQRLRAAPEHIRRRTLEANRDPPLRQQPREREQPETRAADSARCAPRSRHRQALMTSAAGHGNEDDEKRIERHQPHEDERTVKSDCFCGARLAMHDRSTCHDASVYATAKTARYTTW